MAVVRLTALPMVGWSLRLVSTAPIVVSAVDMSGLDAEATSRLFPFSSVPP